MGALQLGIGALATALVSVFNNKTAMPMAVTMCVCAILSFIVLMMGRRVIYKANKKLVQEQSAEMLIT